MQGVDFCIALNSPVLVGKVALSPSCIVCPIQFSEKELEETNNYSISSVLGGTPIKVDET